jgi:cell division protein FtsI (penicillin-binding protein 3)
MSSPSEKTPDKVLKRLYFVLLLVGAFWVFLVGRLGYLIFKYRGTSPYEAQEVRPYLKVVRGERGSILSADGTVWATSLPLFRVAVDPTLWTDQEVADSLFPLSKALHKLFPEYHNDPLAFSKLLRERRQKGDRHVYLFPYKVLLTHTERKALDTLPLLRPRSTGNPLIVEKITHKRSYPYGNLARITLGYLVNDSVAWRGLESAFHDKLQGETRAVLVKRLTGGVEVPLENLSDFEPAPGADIVISLDPHLQDIAYQALSRAVETHRAAGGVLILMEVQTGRILALANYQETYNHAVKTLWEPGSTFKVATAAILLESRQLQPRTRIRVPVELRVADRVLGGPGGGIQTTLTQALAQSNNLAFATLAYHHFGHQPQVFYAYLKQFRLLEPTGITLPGEPAPRYIAPGTRIYNPTTLPWLAIGYNIQLTPLQLLTFYNAIANNGIWVPPRLVDRVSYPSGEEEVPPLRPPQRILSPETALFLRQMMQAVVAEGTAQSIATPLYAIAGKTGTAKKVEKGQYVNRYRASFVGFFPAEKPLYSCIVVIDDPQMGGIHGGEVAAPVFREIADAVVFRDARTAPQEPPLLAERRQPALPTLRLKDAIPLYNALSISTPERPTTPLAKAVPTTYYVQLLPQPDTSIRAILGMPLRMALAHLHEKGYTATWEGHGPMVIDYAPIDRKQLRLRLGYALPS